MPSTTQIMQEKNVNLEVVRGNVPVVEIDKLNVYSKGAHILKNVSTIIPKNKITVLLGPSGCGKTTLLKCLNRLTDLYPDLKVKGSIRIDGEDIFDNRKDITSIRQKMGLLLQRPYPLPMSIYDNIAYGLKLKGIRDKKIVSAKVEKHLREVALWDEVKDRLKTSAQRLSIGQQQRLCLARGLAVEPEPGRGVQDSGAGLHLVRGLVVGADRRLVFGRPVEERFFTARRCREQRGRQYIDMCFHCFGL